MIDDATRELAEGLADLRWHVQTSDRGVHLHRRFKNGKPHKTPIVSLGVLPRAQGRDGRWRSSARPYRVDSPRFDRARTFETLPPAEEAFVIEARALAPNEPDDG